MCGIAAAPDQIFHIALNKLFAGRVAVQGSKKKRER